MKRALIFDLDNTIYPVKSVGYQLFEPLFELMDEYHDEIGGEKLAKSKEEIMRTPFQKVAGQYGFSQELVERGTELLRNLEYHGPMEPFSDYVVTKDLPYDRFLVTMGFTKLQQSKVKGLHLEGDFQEIFIVDPDETDQTKADIFQEIMSKYGYGPEDLLVIGDDVESEIDAAQSLGIHTFLFDPYNRFPDALATARGENFNDLKVFVTGKS